MTIQYETNAMEVSEVLIDRLAEEVRLEIQRRKLHRLDATDSSGEFDLRMPIVLRGRSNSARSIFRSSRAAA